MAMENALHTPGLLEHILLRLPIVDLLIRIPLVSKLWQAVVAASTRLKQALFLKPLKGKSLRVIGTTAGGTVARGRRRAEDENDNYCHTVFINPFYKRLVKLVNSPTITRKEQLDRYVYDTASWRRTLMTQPMTKYSWNARKREHGHLYMEDLLSECDEFLDATNRAHTEEKPPMCMLRFGDSAQCKELIHAVEVRRIARPKPSWL